MTVIPILLGNIIPYTTQPPGWNGHCSFEIPTMRKCWQLVNSNPHFQVAEIEGNTLLKRSENLPPENCCFGDTPFLCFRGFCCLFFRTGFHVQKYGYHSWWWMTIPTKQGTGLNNLIYIYIIQSGLCFTAHIWTTKYIGPNFAYKMGPGSSYRLIDEVVTQMAL